MPRLALPVLLALAALVAAAGCGKKPPADDAKDRPRIEAEAAEVSGKGATFVEPIMTYWTETFRTRTGEKVRISYDGIGSSAGIEAMTKKLAAFGCSDVPLTRDQLAAARAGGGEVVHVPLVVGAVVPIYNVPGAGADLVFTGELLADIFMGKVSRWNDPRLVALNPGLAAVDAAVKPVVRADGSGTSFIFTDYLSKSSQAFRSEVTASTKPNWPRGAVTAQPKSKGVAGFVAENAGTIGYVDLTDALDGKMTFGAVKNRAGKVMRADAAGITAAAAAAMKVPQDAEPYKLHELTYNLTDAAAADAYPIAGMSFAIVYRSLDGDQAGGAKGRAVVAFLKWATSAEGQELAKARNYATLPEELQKKVADKLAAVEVK
ncbi:MAG: phosphate ABC transporter substrate-binding protein PstS [Isosphaera sp.]|nr:phosphate ABC transporter substrate-binding protein PstS [Isosphaera sp.]